MSKMAKLELVTKNNKKKQDVVRGIAI